MAIDMPQIGAGFIVRSRFYLEAHTQTFTSPLTRNTQRVVLPGARWMASYTLRKMHRHEAAQLLSFFDRLEGAANTFNAFDPEGREPRGAASGTPLVNGGSQTGSTLAIDGCTAGVTGWMKTGDYFVINGELKRLTQDANTNGSGEVTLAFKPALRSSPANNAAITVRDCTCTMVLADDGQSAWDTNHNNVYEEITFSAYEVFE